MLQQLKTIISHGHYSVRQIALLVFLSENGPTHHHEIVRSLKLRGATVSRCADTLGIAGLVTREREEADRRHVIISVTASGKKFVTSFHP